MSFKIPCGGFRLDEESFSLDENGVLSVSGGGSDFVVNFSTADTQTFTVDKTYAEVVEAIKSGKFVRGILTVTGEMPAFLQLACKGYDGYELVFNQVGTNFGSHIAVLEIIYSEDGIEFNHVDIGNAT